MVVMNEVETYLRQSGKWCLPVNTDRKGCAGVGTWWPTYYAQWLNVYEAERKEREIGPGGWSRGDDGEDWWITDTPDWDRGWFERQNVKPPQRFGDKANTYWKDYGDGLSGRSYRADSSAVTIGDGGWSIGDWAKVLAAAAACIAVITLLALLPALLAG